MGPVPFYNLVGSALLVVHLLSSFEIARLNHSKSPPRLFVDISQLVQGDSKTGIQRVVRSLVGELLLHDIGGYRVEFIYATEKEPYRFAHRYIERLRCNLPTATADEIANPQEGDIYLGLDCQIEIVLTHTQFFDQIKRNGAKVYFVVYDLLPIFFEDYFAPNQLSIHTSWLNSITQMDGAVCISQSVASELEAWLGENQPIRQQPFGIGWFHPGTGIDASQRSIGLPANAAAAIGAIGTRQSFLLVGKAEPRKGQLQALAAFQLLWDKGIDVNLVLVGRHGWLVDSLLDNLNDTSERGKRLFWLNGVSDQFLEKVYATSTCLLAISEGEGFCLPLIEAAHHKLPIIARDIPVFRGVAGKHAYYFSGLEPSKLANAVVDWLALFNMGRHPKSGDMPPLTWAQSTARLLDVVLNNKWSARWESDGTFRCVGADPRLKTLVGKRLGSSIATTGIEGVLLYGPYILLPEGEYQVKVHGQILRFGVSHARIVITAH